MHGKAAPDWKAIELNRNLMAPGGAVNTFLMLTPKLQPYREIGHRIAERRRELGLERGKRITQRDVAEAVGVALGTVTAWETGKQRPDGENLVKLAEVLDIPPEHITAGRQVEPEPEAEDLFANYDQIVKYVGGVAPPGQDQAVKRDILEGIRRAITATRPLPRWWHELKEKVDRGEL